MEPLSFFLEYEIPDVLKPLMSFSMLGIFIEKSPGNAGSYVYIGPLDNSYELVLFEHDMNTEEMAQFELYGDCVTPSLRFTQENLTRQLEGIARLWKLS